MTEQVRILLISYSALSKEGANGRTLECLLNAVDSEHIAQLFMSEEEPDYSVCNRYFQITDQQVLRSYFKKGTHPGKALAAKPEMKHTMKSQKSNLIGKIAGIARKYKRTSIMKLFRNFVWKQETWNSKALNDWIDSFNPQVILMMSGKSEYFHDLTRIIAQKRNIPLVVYHCEDYYFKNTHPYSIFYQCYRKGLIKSLQKVMEYASLAIYNSPSIMKMYQKEFNTPGKVAYMASDMNACTATKTHEEFVISYLGNLANKRYESLKIFADTLYNVHPQARINIYAPPLGNEEQECLAHCTNISFKGLVSYEECKRVMHESDMLLHIESFNSDIVKDLKIAFSTKIADCLASGVCFFVFAPSGIACTEYLQETQSACLVTNPDNLKAELEKVIFDSDLRKAYVNTALQVAATNHNKQLIGKRVLEAIVDVCREN